MRSHPTDKTGLTPRVGLIRTPCGLERNSILIALALAMLTGCRLADVLNPGAWLWALLPLGAALVPLLRRVGKPLLPALMLLSLAVGALNAGFRLNPTQPAPGSYAVTASVYGEPMPRSSSRLSCVLTNLTLNGEAVPGRAYCTFHADDGKLPKLFDGAQVSFSGFVYKPMGKNGTPHFDYRLWMYRNGMSFGLSTYREAEVLNTPESAPWLDSALHIRAAFGDALARTMGDASRVATAMLFSEREGLSDEELEGFQTLGIAHVLSVSGLHVGLLGLILIWLLKKLRINRYVRLGILILFLAAYCLITGFSAATIRASVMLMLVSVAGLMGRRADTLTTASAAMLVILLADPLEAYSAGFILSFSAVGSIILLSPVFRNALSRIIPRREHGSVYSRFRRLKKAGRTLLRYLGRPRDIFCVALAAQIGILLPVALYFHTVPTYGILINILLSPLISLLIPLYAAALLLSPVPLLGMGIGASAAALSRLFLWLISLLKRLPSASIGIAAPSVLLCICFALCVLALSRRMQAGFARRAAAVGLLGLLTAFCIGVTGSPNTRYIQLSVDQEDAAILYAGDQTVVIDVGTEGRSVADYLFYDNRAIDALYLTHLHSDHIEGVSYLLAQGITIRQVYLPVNAEKQDVDASMLAVIDELRKRGIPVTELDAGDEQQYNDTRVRVLWPERETVRTGQDPNNLPLVLAIDLAGYTLLNTGDLSGVYEDYAAVPCDVLKVAHHGSNSSSYDSFLSTVNPKVALVSCSGTSTSLPGTDTLNRLNAHGIRLLRTDICGDITITPKDGFLTITPYRGRLNP